MTIPTCFNRIAALSCCLAFLVAAAPPAIAQAPSEELIETYDGVKLRGLFYKATTQKNNSVVMILHPYGQDPSKGDYDGLAKTLAGEGYHVLRFDFRGHGKSTDIIPERFWKEPMNRQYVVGANRNPQKKEISFKDFRASQYFPTLVNDIAAARTWIDVKNDSREVNASTIYIIGAGDAATLGMLFITTEWHREGKEPPPVGFAGIKPQYVSSRRGIVQQIDPAGKDYGGTVFLSPMRHASVSSNTIEDWVSKYGRQTDGDMRKETPMLFIHGEKDREGESACKFFVNQVMVAAGKPTLRVEKLDFTFLRSVKGTVLKGVDLLGKNDTLGTEKMIIEFLAKMEEERKKKNPFNRTYTKPLPIDLPSFGVR